MFNVLLDPLPTEWNGYPIDYDYRTGVLISQCLQDPALTRREQIYTAVCLLFPQEHPASKDAIEAVEWFLSEYDHDNHGSKKDGGNVKVMDFDIDQWRIYSAFRQQYGIDLSIVKMHWFIFMGLLLNLDECNFTRVIDIRLKKITDKMGREEKQAIRNAKKVYSLSTPPAEESISEEEKEKQQEAQEDFMRMINKKQSQPAP